MRAPWGSDLPPDLLRSIGLVCLADAFVGVAFGAVTTGAGLPAWLPVVLSVTVFAGAAQFLFVGVVGAVVAVAVSPWLPAGLPVLVALAGVLVALPRAGAR